MEYEQYFENSEQEFEKNLAFYETYKDRIRQHYGPSEYILIKNQKIIDSDTDKFKLFRRNPVNIEGGLGYIIISPHDSDRVCEIPSWEEVR